MNILKGAIPLGTITILNITGFFLTDSILEAIISTSTSRGLVQSPMERMISMAREFTKGILMTVHAILASLIAALLLPSKYSKF